MTKILNGFFSLLKFVLLIISFMLTFYIIMSMYQRLEKNVVNTLHIFIPYLLLFLLMAFNSIFNQKQVTNNLFFNLTTCIVFIVFIFVGYRALMDDFMLARYKTNYNISFHYFSDMVAPLQAMIYLLIAGDVLLMFSKKKEIKTEKVEDIKNLSESKTRSGKKVA